MLKRLLAACGVAAAVVVPTASAYAADPTPPPPDTCQVPDQFGTLPSCTWNGSSWDVNYDQEPGGTTFPDPSDGMPSVGAFAAIGFTVVIGLGIATTVWRVRAARRMAERAGLDPDAAATATLLTNDGLAATYLAANLNRRGDTAAGPFARPDLDLHSPVHHPAPAQRSVEDRLAELGRLRDEGVVTTAEYDSRRAAILDSV